MRSRLTVFACLVAVSAFGAGGVATAGAQSGEAIDVELHADSPTDDFATTNRVIDDLESSAVLKIRLSGFDWFERAEMEQCVYAARVMCANRLPVQADEEGRAVVHFLVSDDFSTAAGEAGRCAPDRNRCTVRIESIEGTAVAEIDTVFGGPARPPGRITVAPQREIDEGSTVQVTVEGYPPGQNFTAALCRAPTPPSPRTCGAPGSGAPITISDDGTGATMLTLTPGAVGSSEATCSRRTICGISLVSDDAYVRALTPPISFAGRAGPDYDNSQLVIGLGIAALLLALAAWWMVTGEWAPPQEAAATALDEAEYADLDAMVAAQDARDIAAGVSPDTG